MGKSLLHPDSLKKWSINVFDALGDGLLIADQEAIVQYVNKEYLRIVGMKKEDIVGKQLSEVRPGAMLPTVIRTGKSLSGVYRKVGTVEYVVDMSPILVNNKIIGGVSIVKDITEVQKLSKELERAQNRLKNLQGTVGQIFKARYTLDQLKGSSPALRKAIALAERAALTNSNILITGESGTGKELLAQAIHNSSTRKHGSFIAINCAAIPANLLESELFGYAEGAFTGSKKGGKIGLFQLADGGTLFLDEIGDMDYDLQAKLLRVLQEQKVRRIGDITEDSVDVRIISATNQDIEKMVEKGRFRHDLFYRLNVFHITLPPLRERASDILHLASIFAKLYVDEERSVTFSPEVKEIFLTYDWPGNIRQLKNVIEFACNMLNEEEEISLQHLPERISEQYMHWGNAYGEIKNLEAILHKREKEVIENALKMHGRDLQGKKKACRELGISLATLYRKMKNF